MDKSTGSKNQTPDNRSPGREAAKRTLDGEDRSGIMQHEGKGIPHPFRQHPLLGGCSEPSRRDKYRR